MTDYKTMYLNLLRAVERAIRELIAAQQACEDLYISSCDDAVLPPLSQEQPEKPAP